MKREIKFRAWIISKEKMIKVFGLNEHLVFEQSWDSPCIKENIFEIEDCILMQFTGLQDKTGVDIYEGDILGGYPHGSVISKWDNNYACFSCYDFEDNDYGLFANELDNCKDAWEVVGNIYENPELLKP